MEAQQNPPAEIDLVFNQWPTPIRDCGYWLRNIIFDTARNTADVGEISEKLKWGQPSFLTEQTGSGSTIRIGEHKNTGKIGLYFHCQTNLVDTFRNHYSGLLDFEGNRAILIDPDKQPDARTLSHCIALALRYHLDK